MLIRKGKYVIKVIKMPSLKALVQRPIGLIKWREGQVRESREVGVEPNIDHSFLDHN